MFTWLQLTISVPLFPIPGYSFYYLQYEWFILPAKAERLNVFRHPPSLSPSPNKMLTLPIFLLNQITFSSEIDLRPADCQLCASNLLRTASCPKMRSFRNSYRKVARAAVVRRPFTSTAAFGSRSLQHIIVQPTNAETADIKARLDRMEERWEGQWERLQHLVNDMKDANAQHHQENQDAISSIRTQIRYWLLFLGVASLGAVSIYYVYFLCRS